MVAVVRVTLKGSCSVAVAQREWVLSRAKMWTGGSLLESCEVKFEGGGNVVGRRNGVIICMGHGSWPLGTGQALSTGTVGTCTAFFTLGILSDAELDMLHPVSTT